MFINKADLNKYEPVDNNYRYYSLLVSIYACLLITAQVLGHRMLNISNIIEPGGIFIFPLAYTIGDIITEVYGLKSAKRAILSALVCQSIFTVLTVLVSYAPYPASWNENVPYQTVFGYSAVVFISNLSAAAISFFFNAKILSILKYLMHGLWFKIRSFISTTIGEIISTGIIVFISFGFTQNTISPFHLFLNMLFFKIFYAFLAMFPAGFLVNFLKRKEHGITYESDISQDNKKIIDFSTYRNEL